MKKRNQFKHLTVHDRDRIHALYGHGHNQKSVAGVLGIHPGTVSRELARYGRKTWRYNAIRAQIDADTKRLLSKRPGMKIEAEPALRQYIVEQLKKLRSPDEIAGRMKRVGAVPRVGTNALYKWLYSEAGKPYCRYLCTRRRSKKKQSRLGKKVLIPNRIPIKYRPTEPGLLHAERDLFVSPTRLHSRPCGLFIVLPELKLFAGSIIANREAKTVTMMTKIHFRKLSPDTCTADNGSENVRHEETGVSTFFCDPGAPWQKPHVEGGIGLIRRWFLPKGTDLATVSDATFQSQLHLLNHKYRKSLGYQSAYEVALKRGTMNRVPRVSLKKAIAFR